MTPVALILVAAVVAAGSNLVVAPVAEDGRYVLRQNIIPPFDPQAYPSPLAGLRKFEKIQREQTLFTVDGLPTGARLRFATMDAYNGLVWNVVNGDGGPADGSGVFRRVGARVVAPRAGAPARVTVHVDTYHEIWLPTVGELTDVSFNGSHAPQLGDSFRYNATTSIGVVPNGLTNGDSYTMDVVIPPDPDPTTLPDHTFASVTMPDLTGVPDEVSTLASDWAGAGGASYAQLVALVDTLKRGAFSDGDAQSGVNAPAGHGAKRVRDFLAGDQLVGDSEQYAAVLALMSRELGMPARVVLGVVPPAAGFTGQVTGAMVSAWVEVDFAGLGWVPFDPTPPVTSLPKKQQVKPQTNPQGTVLDPPILAAQPPVPLPPPQAQEPIPAQECLIGWLCFNLLPRWAQLVIEYVGGPATADHRDHAVHHQRQGRAPTPPTPPRSHPRPGLRRLARAAGPLARQRHPDNRLRHPPRHLRSRRRGGDPQPGQPDRRGHLRPRRPHGGRGQGGLVGDAPRGPRDPRPPRPVAPPARRRQPAFAAPPPPRRPPHQIRPRRPHPHPRAPLTAHPADRRRPLHLNLRCPRPHHAHP